MTGFEPGQVFAGHRIVRRIARGGMGVVYEAVDERLRRRVALKVITVEDEPRFRQRFAREARLLAEFDHPHVLPVFHAGEEDGLPYLTMRLAEGGSLRGVIERGPLPGHALRLLAQLAEALDALHRRGIVHLDVKPENVLLKGPAGDEHVWLADLGLARPVHAGAPSTEGAGTLDYMAPEQWRGGGEVGPAADVYAFGLVLYETLTGHPLHVLDRGSPRLDGEPALREVFERALAREPGERYPSAGALLAQAQAALGDRAPDGALGAGSIAGELLLSGSTLGARPPVATKGGPRTVRWPARARVPVPVLVPVLVAALAWVGWSLRPSSDPPATPSARPARTPVAAEPTGLAVCARHLTVRRDPRTTSATRILATLAPGDRFVVEGSRGHGWVYGHSSGSTTVSGWALRQWLRPRCP